MRFCTVRSASGIQLFQDWILNCASWKNVLSNKSFKVYNGLSNCKSTSYKLWKLVAMSRQVDKKKVVTHKSIKPCENTPLQFTVQHRLHLNKDQHDCCIHVLDGLSWPLLWPLAKTRLQKDFNCFLWHPWTYKNGQSSNCMLQFLPGPTFLSWRHPWWKNCLYFVNKCYNVNWWCMYWWTDWSLD